MHTAPQRAAPLGAAVPVPYSTSPWGAAGAERFPAQRVPGGAGGEPSPLSHTSPPFSGEPGAGADERFCACSDVLSCSCCKQSKF